MPHSPFASWLELERRFRALSSEPHLQGLRLDFQWGSSGEHWNLTGISRDVKYQEAAAISSVAGKLLESSDLSGISTSRSLLEEANATHRWFVAVKELSGTFVADLPAKELNDDGSVRGHIYHGSASQYLAASANLCLKLASEAPVLDQRGWWERLFDEHGREIVVGVFFTLISAVIGAAFGAQQ